MKNNENEKNSVEEDSLKPVDDKRDGISFSFDVLPPGEMPFDDDGNRNPNLITKYRVMEDGRVAVNRTDEEVQTMINEYEGKQKNNK